ncbi:uncharacterized protein At4g19900 [Argentina anserina]|uniref:uncharacterized protein At4g19900 n=1 Tax=Argentina anserina TaxID=57926 RepID=UPI002176322B|nr:uncharacterized protein At4g19900 [Potentilla anserina]
MPVSIEPPKLFTPLFFFPTQLRDLKRSALCVPYNLPSSLLALFLILLLVYNSFRIFCITLPFPAKPPPEPAFFSPPNIAGYSLFRAPPFRSSSPSTKLHSSSVMYVVKENAPMFLKSSSHLASLQNPTSSFIPFSKFKSQRPRKFGKHKRKHKAGPVEMKLPLFRSQFPTRMKVFFSGNSSGSPCKTRFFMTWISSKTLGNRELLAMESVFKSHPNACLVIVSKSLDSDKGLQVLKPFSDSGFRVMAIAPDFDYLFHNTPAEAWFLGLRKGSVRPGGVSIGQNLSNVLRLALLYKYGGIYLDTDVIVLRSLSKMKNVIGAQTLDLQTGHWSRLNNAVLVFDKNHPLLFKFIQEFALTFDGNKWGHNGPYLVSRVVSRINETPNPGFNFTVLTPSAFYPVNWSRIRSIFGGPKDEVHSKWLLTKLEHIRSRSFALHLWNSQSRRLKVQKGSIIDHIMSDFTICYNSSSAVSSLSL